MRIALIAMSGIRACDPELLRLGLTLPGFVERSKTIASLPSLGLLTLGGMIPEHHRVEYIEMPDLNGAAHRPWPFDLAAISTYSAQAGEAYTLASILRQHGVRTVIGGTHVTALPDEAARHADAVVVGEGEPVWERLLADAEAGRLQGRYDGGGDFDLADAPMPAYEILDVARYNRITVQTSRGCPHRCEFCASSVVLTARYKQKPIAKVLAEIERIRSIWEHPFIEFADDNSFVDRAYWKELLPNLRGMGLRWFAETDLTVAEDPVLLELMRETGCAQVLIGLESPVEEPLHGIELRSDWKAKRFPRYKDAIRRIQSHGITVNGCFVLGLDGHGPEIFEEVEAFVRDSGLYEVQVTFMTPFPGTPLHERLEREHRLTHPGRWERCTLFDVNFTPRGMTAPTLERGFKDLVVRLYGEDATKRRRKAFSKNRLGVTAST